MENTNENFDQYLEELTQDIIEGFTVRADQNPLTPWIDFIMSRFTRVL